MLSLVLVLLSLIHLNTRPHHPRTSFFTTVLPVSDVIFQ